MKGERRMAEYDKCNFCKWFSIYVGCQNDYCYYKEDFEANTDKIIEKAREKGISVADVVALINLEG
jgi:hypothetical protein